MHACVRARTRKMTEDLFESLAFSTRLFSTAAVCTSTRATASARARAGRNAAVWVVFVELGWLSSLGGASVSGAAGFAASRPVKSGGPFGNSPSVPSRARGATQETQETQGNPGFLPVVFPWVFFVFFRGFKSILSVLYVTPPPPCSRSERSEASVAARRAGYPVKRAHAISGGQVDNSR